MSVLEYEFMRNALAAAVLVGAACGVVGTYVVTKRIVFISGGISHAALGGVGIGYFLGISPLLAAVPFTALSALSIGAISRHMRVSEDAAIGILWTMGMATGIIFINLTPGYVPDLMSYLFGDILTVGTEEVAMMVVLDAVILACCALLHRGFVAISFDEEFAMAIGLPVAALYYTLLVLVALSVVVLIKIVGVMLVIALLTIPAAACKRFVRGMHRLMVLSTLASIAATVLGLWLSYVFDTSSGATIVMVLGAGFIVSALAGGKAG